MPFNVLFVCLGNICRSPLAEAVFRKQVIEAGLGDKIGVDSAGTGGWHVGDPPDRRMRHTAASHDVSLDDIRARQFGRDDLKKFDLILAMDRSNLHDILRMAGPDERSKVKLFRSFDELGGDQSDVPDPYYGGPEGFERVFEIVDRTSKRILSSIA
ncbi:low molecular weight protein-tyrosine-phosphatase [Bacteroidota bacterium]